MSQNAMTTKGLVSGLIKSSRAFVLGTALIAGSMTMLSSTHAQAEKILRVGNDGEPQSIYL